MVDAKEINETIGRRLRLLREANGWSQREMARRIGRSYNAVYTLESAKTTLHVDDLFLMADLLDVSPVEILRDLLTIRDLQRLNRVWQIERQVLGLSREQAAERLAQITDHTRATYEILEGCT